MPSSSKKANYEMEKERQFLILIKSLTNESLREFCYTNKVGGFTGRTAIVFEELERRGGLCLQFLRSYNHKVGDIINSQLAGKRICYNPTKLRHKEAFCPHPMELDEKFIKTFNLKAA